MAKKYFCLKGPRKEIISGWLLSGRGIVTRMIVAAGFGATNHFWSYRRLSSTASWSLDATGLGAFATAADGGTQTPPSDRRPGGPERTSGDGAWATATDAPGSFSRLHKPQTST